MCVCVIKFFKLLPEEVYALISLCFNEIQNNKWYREMIINLLLTPSIE